MLLRLKVSGFKNLVDVDIRFGPFTCIAGANGVGKSNLFDAIMFLSALASKELLDAAVSVRGERGRAADILSLFHRIGDTSAETMSFDAEMIIPSEGVDDLGQTAEAGITFLRYGLTIGYREGAGALQGGLAILKEELTYFKRSDAAAQILFPHKPSWRNSVVKGARRSQLISTEETAEGAIIKLHQDSGGEESKSRGRPKSFRASVLPRTVLSTASAAESRTALLARNEMRSWRLLQLEPSALRQPDEITAPRSLGANGSHLPATLFRLAGGFQGKQDSNGQKKAASIYAELTNCLSELIDDVREVRIDRDEKRELLTLEVVDRQGTPLAARSLSDGTLRFLALAVFAMDSKEQGVLCLEEPENGIHPERIPAMIRLLEDIAVDTNEPAGHENPLTQVIINTHSPAVVSQVQDNSLLVAEAKEAIAEGKRCKRLSFGVLPDTWRGKASEGVNIVSRGKLLSYLNPILPPEEKPQSKVGSRRVVDRKDIESLLPYLEKLC